MPLFFGLYLFPTVRAYADIRRTTLMQSQHRNTHNSGAVCTYRRLKRKIKHRTFTVLCIVHQNILYGLREQRRHILQRPMLYPTPGMTVPYCTAGLAKYLDNRSHLTSIPSYNSYIAARPIVSCSEESEQSRRNGWPEKALPAPPAARSGNWNTPPSPSPYPYL